MADIQNLVMRSIEDDVTIHATDVGIEITNKGLFRRRGLLRITGMVRTELEKAKIGRIAEHHAGVNYEVANDLTVKRAAVDSPP